MSSYKRSRRALARRRKQKLKNILAASACLLIVLGCAVHSGSRHAIALGNKKLMRGNRLRLTAPWFMGCVLVLPFAAVVVYALGDYALSLVRELKNLKLPAFTLSVKQAALLIGGVTFFICWGGVLIGRKAGTKLAGKAGIFGGVILIAIGLEIFISSFL